jgi:hypothetical protein
LLSALLYNERIDKIDSRLGKRDLTPGAKAELEGPRPAAPKVPHRPPPPPKTQEKRWSHVEEAILASLVDVHGDGSWDLVAANMRSRSSASVARHWFAMRSRRRPATDAVPADALTSAENKQMPQGADRTTWGTWLQHVDRESDGSDLVGLGLGGQKKALPEGWTETVHEAPARSYSTFAGPAGQRARSIAEAWRMHNAAGGGVGGAGGAAVTGGSGVAALDASSVLSAQSARLGFLSGEASWASGDSDDVASASEPATEYIPSHCVALSHAANVPAYATVVVTAEEID